MFNRASVELLRAKAIYGGYYPLNWRRTQKNNFFAIQYTLEEPQTEEKNLKVQGWSLRLIL